MRKLLTFLARPNLLFAACLFCVVSFSHEVHAGVYACAKAGGGTVFQDNPCPVVKSPELPSKPKATNFPLGIHNSWFDKPKHAPDIAFCSKRSCDCGPFVRRNKAGMTQAIADALYLDGSWHRLENALLALQKVQLEQRNDYDAHYEVQEASCNILMSQKLLLKYANATVSKLSNSRKQVENNQEAIIKLCDNGNKAACQLLDEKYLHQQITADAEALKRNRLQQEILMDLDCNSDSADCQIVTE